MPKISPIDYIRQVRAEAKKVTWPSRRETTVSAIAVFIMVTVASIFLYFADQLIAILVRAVMGFGF